MPFPSLGYLTWSRSFHLGNLSHVSALGAAAGSAQAVISEGLSMSSQSWPWHVWGNKSYIEDTNNLVNRHQSITLSFKSPCFKTKPPLLFREEVREWGQWVSMEVRLGFKLQLCLWLSVSFPPWASLSHSQRWSFTHLMIPSLKHYYLGIWYLLVARDSLMSSHKHSSLQIIISTS